MAVSDQGKSMGAQAPQRVSVDGVELESRVVGTGEPVLLVHGSHIADAFAPLLSDPALTERYRLVSYHRRGFAGSTHPDRPLSIAEQAADCRGLMGALGIDRAHVVGHSYGGVIALQLALDAPSMVHSLALLEPALMGVPSAQQLMEALGPAAARYQAGDKAGAVDTFLRAVVGADYRRLLDEVVPGGYEQAVADADTFFAQELPALQEWRFTREEARRITQPVLAVLGADSAAVWAGFGEGYALLREWFPQAEGFTLSGANHALQMQNPGPLAAALAAFLARHPLPVRA
jgi:pimeloyl-ACP methyl ester carboxylesterase